MDGEPLASLLRPDNLSDFIGQEHILGPGKMLRRMIEADQLSSIVLYGPPGTGKTTTANMIAHMTKSDFRAINATTAGKADMKKVVDAAIENKRDHGRRTILFIDEIHRFNRAQQDFLLPYVELGTVVLVGATTENPYFEINGALLSRSQIFELRPLTSDNIRAIIRRAIDKLNAAPGAKCRLEIDPKAEQFFIDAANGDARQVLNAIDLAFRTTDPDEDGTLLIGLETASECIQKKIKQYDKDGDNHYDTISAFIESMKHSEVDASLYYLARMLDRGEDPKYIARRLIVCASRDIGPGCPQALDTAVSAFLAVERVGMPECRDALAMSTIINCMAPKSPTMGDAFLAAMADAVDMPYIDIPDALRDESYKSARKLGHGGVSDAVHAPMGYDGFECMPAPLVGKRYYFPGGTGLEPTFRAYMERNARIKAQFDPKDYASGNCQEWRDVMERSRSK